MQTESFYLQKILNQYFNLKINLVHTNNYQLSLNKKFPNLYLKVLFDTLLCVKAYSKNDDL
jgi:hypothetical protein